MKTIVEIHVLQNFAPSNLNRDDTGAPKDALFGGTRRARVSSQCLKRSVREYFKDQNKGWVADRTKRVVYALKERISPVLESQKDFSEDNLLKAIEVAVSNLGSNKKVKVDKEKKSDVLLFLSPKEIDALAQVVAESYADLLKTKLSDQVVRNLNDAIDGENKSRLSVDVALFGRMLAVMPEKNQNAACQVAHAISTHAVEREFDFYTAVDDLKPEDTAGADMMGTVEFNSACFYRYAVVDWEKLLVNLQADEALATKGLRAFLEGFVVAEPTGKQNTFAAHNPPEFVAVTVRRNAAPRNLANAFETAVRVRKDESLTRKSAEGLANKAKALQSAFGGDEKTFVLNLAEATIDGFGIVMPTLNDLLDKALLAVQE
ncbi:type I-E CRISPR-associated protein Cas7/Cse4/CasC [Pelobacter propionicus]|uniref:CRISPR-associated protein, Cse4 family n=1 Tax=Pelobacter propionicus (strain DSM 2379 / NBRC 103807 / OttBd1) TaxID=338966 RepID=A1ARH7_PELPD|nr:type I-E CRISPR-associated protein Cas7/Cse4/CasC [Pelobacter propionicus]ABK99947.1 CRISPR-associated protein, Cse4 family [Pelobacter propionicus DSM 2379]